MASRRHVILSIVGGVCGRGLHFSAFHFHSGAKFSRIFLENLVRRTKISVTVLWLVLRAACLNVACSGVFLDACLSATLSSVVLNAGGAAPFYRLDSEEL